MDALGSAHSLVLEAMSEGFILADTDGQILHVNPAYARMTGFSQEELEGQNIGTVEATLETPEIARSIAAFVEHSPLRFETRHRCKNGEVVDLDVSIVVVESEGRTLIAAFTRDLRTQRAKEQRLIELDAAIRRTQRLEGIGRLASGIAHDLNNALTPILIHTEFARSALEPDHEARVELDGVLNAAAHARSLIKRLLAFSAHDSTELVNVDLADCLAKLRPLLHTMLRENVELIVRCPPDLPAVIGVPDQLEQVFVNLALNAQHAMPDGGTLEIVAEASREPCGIRSQLGADLGSHCRIRVRDTGSGMPSTVLEHIFEPFFTTRSRDGGTGIGLSTVHSILRQHGGRIDVQSAPGEGTTFRLCLQFAGNRAPTEAHREPPGRVAAANGRATIVVVDDDPEVRRVATLILRTAGHVVAEFRSGEEALAAAAGLAEPDLLVSDVILGGMDGTQTLDGFRARFPKLKALLMSGHTFDMLGSTDLDPGIQFLAKPFTAQLLLDRVRGLLAAQSPGNPTTR